MRQMRPLFLPGIVASQRTSSMPSSPTACASVDYLPTLPKIHAAPSTESLPCLMETSDSSSTPSGTPNTSFDERLRTPTSPIAHSFSSPNSQELRGLTAKLPNVEENPVQFDTGIIIAEGKDLPCLCDNAGCPHERNKLPRLNTSPAVLDWDTYWTDESEVFWSRPTKSRRRSGDGASPGITNRLNSRFSSLSKRMAERRTPSTASQSRQPQAVQPTSSRSSSMTAGTVAPAVDTRGAVMPPTPTRSICDVYEDVDLIEEEASEHADNDRLEEPFDRVALASTPLLPPLVDDGRVERETPVHSPLQSPSIAAQNPLSVASSPVMGAPQAPAMPTPPLSTKPSVSSFHRSRTGHLLASPELPPLPAPEEDDEWAGKLGHANFTIYPEPYIPDMCDMEGCRQLFADWDKARTNFFKHLVRTGEHYGVTSKTYKFTELKWTDIDLEWRFNHDLAMATAASRGEELTSTPMEPAPLTQMPDLHDPANNGKFPILGDEDVVGPMSQAPAPAQTRPKRQKRPFFRFLGDVKFPTLFQSRGSTGIHA